MKNNSKYIFIISLFMIVMAGCSNDAGLQKMNMTNENQQLWDRDSFLQRFREATPQNPTVVESAIELSDKYARLSEEAILLRQQNQNLAARNEQLRQQVVDIENKLNQTQKELSEANEVLIGMRLELTNWKSDVLGFREEMRNAESAQLQALMKIIKVLGGDSTTETARSRAIGQAVASANR